MMEDDPKQVGRATMKGLFEALKDRVNALIRARIRCQELYPNLNQRSLCEKGANQMNTQLLQQSYSQRPKVYSREEAYAEPRKEVVPWVLNSQRPEVQARKKAWIKAYHKRPEVKQKLRQYGLKYSRSLKGKLKKQISNKIYKQRPDIQAKDKAYRQLPEVKARLRAFKQTPEYKEYNKIYQRNLRLKQKQKQKDETKQLNG